MGEEDIFVTDNLYLSAFLSLQRIERVGYSRDERGRVTFKFAGKEPCDQLRARYELSEVPISIPEFVMHLNRLRDIVFGGSAHRKVSTYTPG